MKLPLTLFWTNLATRYCFIICVLSIIIRVSNPYNSIYNRAIVDFTIRFTSYEPDALLTISMFLTFFIMLWCGFGFSSLNTYYKVLEDPAEMRTMSRSIWPCDKAAVKVARKHLKLK